MNLSSMYTNCNKLKRSAQGCYVSALDFEVIVKYPSTFVAPHSASVYASISSM